MWTLVYTKQAMKDTKKLAASGLKAKAEELLDILRRNPYQNRPAFEKLIGDLAGACSRRINIQCPERSKRNWCLAECLKGSQQAFYRVPIRHADGYPPDWLRFFGAQNRKLFSGFSPAAIEALRQHSWPGDLRELRNAVERAAILCPAECVGPEHLPASVAPRPSQPQLGDLVSLKTVEEQHIRRVVAACRTLQEAADVLGIDQATL